MKNLCYGIAALITLALLAACDIAESSGSYALTWELPTTNLDGSSLDDLAGIRIYEVTCSGDIDATLGQSSADDAPITLDATCSAPWERTEIAETGPEETTYSGVVSPGWHYWAVTSFDEAGNESALSNVGGKNVRDELFPNAPTNFRVD